MAFAGVDAELQTDGTSIGSKDFAKQDRSKEEKDKEKKKHKDLVAWQHMIDVATILTQAQIIPNREAMTLLEGAYNQWFKYYGFHHTIETYQESGLLSMQSKE